ncbi:MAG: protein BatD [Bacteroidetes bacterium]|nr:protein BatD [Bacteroidota bacterium]
MKKIKILFVLLLSAITSVMAQKFVAQASKTTVAVGEAFQISYTLNTSGSNFKVPALKDFDVYSGPNQSTSMSFVNGAMSQSVTLSYVIAAKKEGKITIGPATVNVDGKTIQSNSLTFDVVKGSNNYPNSSNQGNANNTAPSENVSDNLFIRATVNKTKAVVGEQISVVYKVYTRYQLRGFQDIKFPDFNGFYSMDVPMNNQQVQVTNENLDGVNYQVAELKHSFLFPQRTGKIEIPPMEAELVVRKKSNRQPRDIFEQFFGGGYEDAVYSVKSKVVQIDVQALPDANKPKSFNGAVGDFSYKVQLSKDKVKANEAVNLKITLTGKGNIKLVDAPELSFPDDFEVYDPKENENIVVNGGGVSGSKTFDYVLIPRYEGDYKIDQIQFTYFNADKKEYVSIPSPELLIHVEKGDASAAKASVFNPTDKNDVKILGEDIKYIKINNSEFKPLETHFFGSVIFYLCLIIPFSLFAGTLWYYKKQLELNKNIVAVKSKKATKLAKKKLAIAEKYLKLNNKELFYAETLQAIQGYVCDKLNIDHASLNKDRIQEELAKRSVSMASIVQLLELINSCEFARYAPAAVSADLPQVYQSTVELITKIEDEIR